MALVSYDKTYNCGVCFYPYTFENISKYPDYIFVFDNDTCHNKDIANLSNVIGITTKWFAGTSKNAYVSDNKEDLSKIMKDFAKIKQVLAEGKKVYFPHDGIGIKTAKLHIHAPLILDRIDHLISKLVGANYRTIYSTQRIFKGV